MFKQSKFCFLCLVTILSACGTIIGNGITDPTGPSSSPISGPPLDYNIAIEEYEQNTSADCGSFTENNSVSEIDAGRQCIRDALETCTESKYLYNKHNTDSSRFVSFVSVEQTQPDECRLRVHTISNVAPNPIGNKIKTCTTIEPNEIPEVACGILD